MPLEPDKYVGKIVEVKFLDHIWGGESKELQLCQVYGRLIHDDWQKLIIRVWEAVDDDTADTETVVLIRSAVSSIRPLTYEENE